MPKRTPPISDSARLLALFTERAGDLTQAEFGKKHGIGSQGMVWQYLHGRAPLNIDAAKKFAVGLGVKLSDVSPSLSRLEGKGGVEPRINVTMQIKPSLHGDMLSVYAKRKGTGERVKLYEIYEAAIEEYIARHCEK